MQHNWGLPTDVVTQARAVFARYPQITRAVLFGSRAMATYKPGSDIDIALYGQEELTPDLLYKIMIDLDDLSVPYTFDITLYQKISNAALRQHIDQFGVDFFVP